MNSIKFNDWQEMALKKDTEAIIKKLNVQEPIVYSLCWEIVIALGVIIVDRLFDVENTNIYAWAICIIAAVLPPGLIILYRMIKWFGTIKRIKSGKYKVRHFIDIFDNQICYWVMMCNSYSRLLSNTSDSDSAEKIFLYQEGCYYINKSIQALYKMKPVMDKVFSNEHEEVIKKNLVAIYRLLSLLEMMNQYQEYMDSNVMNIISDLAIKEQMEINSNYQEQIKRFVSDMNDEFKTEFSWR